MFNKRQIRELEETIESLKFRMKIRDEMLSDNDFTIIQMNKTNSKLHEKINFYENSVRAYDQQERRLKEQLRVANGILDLFQQLVDSLTEQVNRKDDDIETLLYDLYTANKRIKTLEESNKEAYTKLYSTVKENGKLRKENVKLKLNSKYGTLIHAVCPECSEEISDLLGDLYESIQHEEYLKAKLCFTEEINKMQDKMLKS